MIMAQFAVLVIVGIFANSIISGHIVAIPGSHSCRTIGQCREISGREYVLAERIVSGQELGISYNK